VSKKVRDASLQDIRHRPLTIPVVSWRAVAETLGPLVILSALALFAALHYVRPAPPDTLTIASGPAGSTFRAAAEKYQKILARNAVKLKIVPSEGSLDNLKRLVDPTSGIDIGFVQSGVTVAGDTSDVVSLGSVFYAPLTIFYRSNKTLERLSQLRDKRIAIGAEGSGTRFLALALLKANEIEEQGPIPLLDLEGEAARRALLLKQADAIFLTGDSAAPATIREMLHAPGIRLFNFSQADAYVRRFRYLSRLDVPAGAFDLGENLPATSVTLLAPKVELLAHSSLHPALSDLLIEAAIEVHGRATLMQNANQFPTPDAHEFPISSDAARFYKSGKSFAYRYLPFWLASLLDRALVVLLPIIVVVIPGLRVLPQLYRLRVDRRIHRRYGELMALERETLGPLSPDQRAALIDRLAEFEKAVIARKMPGSHADQIYVLREHINFVRERLQRSGERSDNLQPAADRGSTR
jgi:TRAP-type uncharacterized transport system substrate-binding protein